MIWATVLEETAALQRLKPQQRRRKWWGNHFTRLADYCFFVNFTVIKQKFFQAVVATGGGAPMTKTCPLLAACPVQGNRCGPCLKSCPTAMLMNRWKHFHHLLVILVIQHGESLYLNIFTGPNTSTEWTQFWHDFYSQWFIFIKMPKKGCLNMYWIALQEAIGII